MDSKVYYKANMNKVLEYQKEYNDKNKKKVQQRQKLHYEKNKVKILERNSKYRKAHKRERALYDKKRYRTDPDTLKRVARKRRDLKKVQDFMYTKQDEIATRIVFPRCEKCGSNENLQIDHFYPLSKGFGLKLNNAIMLCQSCNCSKGSKMPQNFFSPDEMEIIEYKLAMVSN